MYERDKEKKKLYNSALESRLHELKVEKKELRLMSEEKALKRQQIIRYSQLIFQIKLYENKIQKENENDN